MRTVTEIIEAIRSLSAKEKEELLVRLNEVDVDGARERHSSLQVTMNGIRDKVKSRGMTPEILEALLRDE